MISVTINGEQRQFDVPADTPILWVLRDFAKLTGSRFGCGMALCGACTVHLDGQPIRSCVSPISMAAGKHITTIEAIENDSIGRRVQQAWMDEAVAQCGYCQSGQIMSAVALLKQHPNPTDAQIDTAMAGNICRCGTYTRIRSAIHRAAGQRTASAEQTSNRNSDLFTEVKA
ncbi:(2Fe-2S)-binding protein [Oceanobacter mangrovi]|uniref:(2Fe-2S)-binding protein n=1 Tax=Oceanobacter mangrovi TaxID=2862510 RepID=UPI001C8E3BF3|nr:(2Fe-2S)-binding protein [Oceanobacter mangrovi]